MSPPIDGHKSTAGQAWTPYRLDGEMAEREGWSIDIPGLTYDEALRIRDIALADAKYGVLILDPASTMVRGFDRPTVELLATCLRAGLEHGDLGHLDAAGAQSMLEDCEAWLRQAK